ncbi:MAG: cytochrome c biogenesis protein ResB [Chloroflexota bacterium]
MALNPLGRLGWFAWHTLTSVKFAVLQISILAVAGVFGAVLRQVPSFALHDPSAYADQMAQIHAAYDPLSILGLNVGPGMVDIFERLGLFRVFSAPWFVLLLTLLVVSIVVCTLDRLPDLWRTAHRVRVVQAAPFFDLRLEHRAAYVDAGADGGQELRQVLRGSRYKVREEVARDKDSATPILHVYGDKNQYMKLATLFTHLGLILFLAGAAVTTALGYETVVFLGEGQTAPVQSVGTPDNLLVKNIHFDAPTRPDGSFADFTTDLAVYRNGQEVARKIIRVNDPLEVDGYVFHQNTFGPAESLSIWDASGQLVWDGPVLLDGELAGLPQGFLTIPGSDLGLLVVLNRATDGTALLALTGIAAQTLSNGSNVCFLQVVGLGSTTTPGQTCGYTIGWAQASAYTGMVIKRDPGQSFIWIAYLSLILGLALSFYFPRRRVWARLAGDRLEIAMAAERYVDVDREFDRLKDELSARLRNRPESRLQPTPTGTRP